MGLPAANARIVTVNPDFVLEAQRRPLHRHVSASYRAWPVRGSRSTLALTGTAFGGDHLRGISRPRLPAFRPEAGGARPRRPDGARRAERSIRRRGSNATRRGRAAEMSVLRRADRPSTRAQPPLPELPSADRGPAHRGTFGPPDSRGGRDLRSRATASSCRARDGRPNALRGCDRRRPSTPTQPASPGWPRQASRPMSSMTPRPCIWLRPKTRRGGRGSPSAGRTSRGSDVTRPPPSSTLWGDPTLHRRTSSRSDETR